MFLKNYLTEKKGIDESQHQSFIDYAEEVHDINLDLNHLTTDRAINNVDKVFQSWKERAPEGIEESMKDELTQY